jgi:hypothetical protein
MSWLHASGEGLSAEVFQRALALVYAVAFLAAVRQIRPLLGADGLQPIARYVARVPFRSAPSLFHLRYSDRLVAAVGWTGLVVAAANLLGIPQRGPVALSMLAWLVLWVLYQSIVNVGQTFYGFGWESLLLEVGFLAVFLGDADARPAVVTMWLLRWLLFRLELGAGLIKLRGDPCWRDLTCLRYHHETQPMPNPLSWWFHHLPMPLHRIEVAANHATQLVVPWFLFAPEPLGTAAAVIVVVTQLWLMLSGNFSWLNFLTIALGLAAIDGSLLARVLPVDAPLHLSPVPVWFTVLSGALLVLVATLSWSPVRNMLSKRQRMNASFDNLHLVGSYGAFGSITKVRYEIIVEGTSDAFPSPASEWRAYELKAKPGDPHRRPPQVAPYHLRLDWLFWFAALSPGYAEGWFAPFLQRLLEGDRPTLKLLRHDPFPDAPPTYVRARLFRYRFTTRAERRATGAWWERTFAGDFVRPVSLADL